MTTVKLATSMPPKTGASLVADDLYRDGQGHTFVGVVRGHVAVVATTDDGPRVGLKIDQFEIADDASTEQVAELLDKLILDRGGDPTLPFGQDDPSTIERYHAFIGEWADEKNLTSEGVQQRWHEFFNPSADPDTSIAGPKGASEQHLREFLIGVGAMPDSVQTSIDDATEGDETEPSLDD
jgi:hypothetical protein